MAELYEAADEIRRALLPTPDQGDGAGEDEGSDADTGEGDTTSRYFWDASHQPHRPTAPRAQNEDEAES